MKLSFTMFYTSDISTPYDISKMISTWCSYDIDIYIYTSIMCIYIYTYIHIYIYTYIHIYIYIYIEREREIHMISISSPPDLAAPPWSVIGLGVVQPRRLHGGSSDAKDLPGESFQGCRVEAKAPMGTTRSLGSLWVFEVKSSQKDGQFWMELEL